MENSLKHLFLLLVGILSISDAFNPESTTRREYFGSVVGTALLPSVANAAVSDNACVAKIKQAFPSAMTNTGLLNKVTLRLARYGFNAGNTLVALSLCSDEVSRPLEETFVDYYTQHFAMGGLAGFPFSGVTGFSAMASHVPDSGNCLLVYGPHVGIDSNGKVGMVNRRGKINTGTCCGSAVAASKYIAKIRSGELERPTTLLPQDSLDDIQQALVSSFLLPYADRIFDAKDPMVELPYVTFEPIDDMMERILSTASGKVANGNIAVLGGIQINTPGGVSEDYFLPLRFDVRNNKNQIQAELLGTLV